MSARFTRVGFWKGLAAGVLLVFAVRAFVNETPVADWIIAPLLMADDNRQAAAIVVLGAGLLQGCIPNENGVQRVLLGARLWREGRAPIVIFAGGGGDPQCSVATAMGQLAEEIGVPSSAIRLETASLSTWENGALLSPRLRAWGLDSITLVTDKLHMPRTFAVFRRLGFDAGHVAVPIPQGHHDNVSMLRAGLREYVALAYYRLRGWVGDAGAASPANPRVVPVREESLPGTGPIAILGASYAAGWKPAPLDGIPLVNLGVTGQQTAELLARFDADVASLNPRAVILWGFINDLFRAPDGNLDAALQRARENYQALIARARVHGIEPILATEVTMRPPFESFRDRALNLAGAVLGRKSYQDAVNAQVSAMNRWLLETGIRDRLLVLDFQSVLSEPGGRRIAAFSQPDGSHITAAGYDALTSYAGPILSEFLVGR